VCACVVDCPLCLRRGGNLLFAQESHHPGLGWRCMHDPGAIVRGVSGGAPSVFTPPLLNVCLAFFPHLCCCSVGGIIAFYASGTLGTSFFLVLATAAVQEGAGTLSVAWSMLCCAAVVLYGVFRFCTDT
jgi:hypothetical protein